MATPEAGRKLITGFPDRLLQTRIAGFAPIGTEIDLWPLLHHLHARGRDIGLPLTGRPATALTFRRWTPACEMATDRYGAAYPVTGETLVPQLVLLPLLAFTADGRRLGYGGGYYDRTLAALRSTGEVFACGVAYAGQETDGLPIDRFDQPLDGILTEQSFRKF